MKDYEIIADHEGDYSHSVLVPEHSDETRIRAAKVLLHVGVEPWDEDTEAAAVEQLAAAATAISLTEHATRPTDEQGCGCEDVGWWCESPSNGGPTRDFWCFEWGDIEDAREVAERMPDDEEDEVYGIAEVTS